ncbi:hypothetical protein BRADI_1g05811v3 [Brachypodium distachyon]|uniref:Uncharacterized protein n=1 Tax=Brachypodium distachyon TaxID=15368 RepID=A0A2K2DI76_BRADI|nr:hypothetical protein BRADI_1g05811v3 [Brachypodium distachyon]
MEHSSFIDGIDLLFMKVLETGDLDLEQLLVLGIRQLAGINPLWEEYINLSEPSSEEDNLDRDPDYEGEEEQDYQVNEENSDDAGAGANGDDGDDAGAGANGDDGDDDGDDDDDDGDDDDDDDDPDFDPMDEDEEDDEEEELEDDDDVDDPDYDPEEEEEDAAASAHTFIKVTIKRADMETCFLHLVPGVHVLHFGNLNVLERIRLWRRGDRRGFDFFPSETLKRVWRLDLFLMGLNPADYAAFEPPVPEPGDYEDEGWYDNIPDDDYGDEASSSSDDDMEDDMEDD